MNAVICPNSLFDTFHEKLELRWIAGEERGDCEISSVESDANNQTCIGLLNLIHPNYIQVIGKTEVAYLQSLAPNSLQDTIAKMFAYSPAMVIFADGYNVEKLIVEVAKANKIPVFASRFSANQVIDDIRYYLSHVMAKRTTLHGVLLDVFGVGILLTGECGIGKSELALELITREHRLVADDAPVFARIAPDTLCGYCPDVLQDFLEVRGLGILDIRALFGDTAISRNKYLELIINLVNLKEEELQSIDRFHGDRKKQEILGLNIPMITLPVSAARNLSILVEVAVRDHLLQLGGYNATTAFCLKQESLISNNTL